LGALSSVRLHRSVAGPQVFAGAGQCAELAQPSTGAPAGPGAVVPVAAEPAQDRSAVGGRRGGCRA